MSAWPLLPGLIGLLAAFRSIYERYPFEAGRLIRTLPGGIFLLTRAALPTVTCMFVIEYKLMGDLQPFIVALSSGTGTEAILRTQIYLVTRKTPAGDAEDILWGPLDLLKWYENLCLHFMGLRTHELRNRVIQNIPQETDFAATLTRVDQLPDTIDKRMRSEALEVRHQAQHLFDEDQAPASAEKNRKYVEQLAVDLLAVIPLRLVKPLFGI